ncbi:MAG: DUF4148 domain-containing protein [Solirubrobacteraceae bacterium]
MRRSVLTVLACCLATAAVVSATALAGGSGSTASPPPTRAQVRAELQALRTAREDRVAARLGKTGDELRSARAAALAAVLGRAVRAGRLTAPERAAILACRAAPLTCDRSNLPARPRVALRGLRRAVVRGVAARLGVSLRALRAAVRAERH